MEEEDPIEVVPPSIQLSIDDLEQKFTIQNLTLSYIAFKVISPNPIIHQFDINQGVLDPCSSQEITLTAKYDSSINFECFQNNNIISIFTHDLESEQNIEWNAVHPENIKKYELTIDIISSAYSQMKQDYNVIIAQKLNMEQFSDDEKKVVLNYCFEQYGRTDNHEISNSIMIFNYQKKEKKMKGNVHVIQNGMKFFFLLTYTPCNYIMPFSKYPLDPMSPQQIKKPKLLSPALLSAQKSQPIKASSPQKHRTHSKRNSAHFDDSYLSQSKSSKDEIAQNQSQIQKNSFRSPQLKAEIQQVNEIIIEEKQKEIKQQQQNIEQPIQQVIKQQSPQLIQEIKNEQIQQQLSVPSNRRMYQSEAIRGTEYEYLKQSPKKNSKQSFLTPIIIEKNNTIQNQYSFNSPQIPIQPHLKRIALFNTYYKINKVLLFKDHSHLITVGNKQIIKVWSLNLNSEIGMIKEHEDLKKVTISEMYEWPETDERKFATIGSDQVIRIFSIDLMKQIKELKIKQFSELTSICFLPDREYVCFAGTPPKQFNIFGSKYPKYRYLKLFQLTSLEEILQYKLPSREDQILKPVIYTDNEDLKHSRLNNILIVCKQHPEKGQGEIILLLLDMDDQCTVIMNLSFDQLAIYGVKSFHYLPLRGSFVIVEKNDPKAYQNNKLLVINVKQLQTEDGLKSGIICKLFDEPSIIDDEVYVIPKQEYILKVDGDIVHLIDLKTNGQFNLQINSGSQIGEDPKNIIMAGKIIRIDGEMVSILELQN